MNVKSAILWTVDIIALSVSSILTFPMPFERENSISSFFVFDEPIVKYCFLCKQFAKRKSIVKNKEIKKFQV